MSRPGNVALAHLCFEYSVPFACADRYSNRKKCQSLVLISDVIDIREMGMWQRRQVPMR